MADETGLLGVAAESHLELSQGPADRKGLIEVPAAALARQGFPTRPSPARS